MSTIGMESSGHAIARFSSRLHQVLDGLLGAPAWSMTVAEQRTVLVELSRAEARISELRLRVLAEADRSDVAAESGASSTAAWLAHATRRVRAVARADVRLAEQLDTTYTATRDALASGLVDLGQSRVIVRAIDALPESADAAVRELAEKHLIDLAAEHDEKTLQVLGRRVLEVVDPDAADIEDGRKLAAEERAAARATYLHLWDNGDGTHTGRFKIPSFHAAALKKMLHAFVAPRRIGSVPVPGAPEATSEQTNAEPTQPEPDLGAEARPPTQPVLTRPERMGQGFCELLERIPGDWLPKAGGVSPTVVVLLDFDKLLSGLGAARLDTGEAISAALARRLACEAGIIPTVYRRVMDGRSVVLDMGRRTRLHTEHQRIALDIEHGGCSAEGCDRPSGWCHAHHETPWSHGGGTSVDNGRLLCPFHHRKAHSDHYETQPLSNGKVRFHRRP
jgi:Domain of unknown function (DUF222)